jgi:hypothetical protein
MADLWKSLWALVWCSRGGSGLKTGNCLCLGPVGSISSVWGGDGTEESKQATLPKRRKSNLTPYIPPVPAHRGRYQDASSTRYKSAPLRKLCCCRTRLGVWQKGTQSALNWALLPPPRFRPRTSQLRRDLALHRLDGRATTAGQSRSASCAAPELRDSWYSRHGEAQKLPLSEGAAAATDSYFGLLNPKFREAFFDFLLGPSANASPPAAPFGP